MVAFGEVASWMKNDLSGMDDTGLARWTYMTFSGRDGTFTTAVVGYNPCKTPPTAVKTCYQQHRHYFTTQQRNHTCPRQLFHTNLITQLKAWRLEGRRLIVCLDANEHMYTGSIGKSLTDKNGLDMVEAVSTTTGKQLSATYFRGSRPIDAVWCTKDVVIRNACALPIGYGVGDHRAFVVDFTTHSLVGINPQPIVHPKARRLNTKIPGCLEAYTTTLEQDIARHRLIEKLFYSWEDEMDF